MKFVPASLDGSTSFHDAFQYSWTISSETFSVEAFRATLLSLVLYPERSSSAILRADILEGDVKVVQETSAQYILGDQWEGYRAILRRLLPRKPRIDDSMTQVCSFYSSNKSDMHEIVIFEPLPETRIPFYHPQVRALAFEYTPKRTSIAYVPLSDAGETGASADPTNERTQRTLLQLLAIVGKHSTGAQSGYVKRVLHDVVVPKDQWQDIYLTFKDRYAKYYIDNWAECTDPLKHVFEDLAIAAFLTILYRQRSDQDAMNFVDIGCGNGLLVELLHREGMQVDGFDARARKSWCTYQPNTQSILQEMVLFPSMLSSPYLDQDSLQQAPSSVMKLHNGLFGKHDFLIGNHADELTPYIPLLAALATNLPGSPVNGAVEDDVTTTAGFMIIPCCTYTFSGAKHTGLCTTGGRYASYIKWLIEICEEVGWIVEREALRIPSTRNHAIIGRRRRRVEMQHCVEAHSTSCNRSCLLQICQNIVSRNGGMDDFLMRGMSLNSTAPRSH